MVLSTLSPLNIGEATFMPVVQDGELRSLGAVSVAGVPLRNTHSRFLPWFDTYEGEVFRRFMLSSIETEGEMTRLRTRAISDPDVLFRERRDS